jgi:hypothetical protein
VTTWKQKKAAIREAVEFAARIDRLNVAVPLAGGGSSLSHLVAWAGERAASRWTGGGAWIDLRFNWITTISNDESRQSYDEDTDIVTYEYGGHREFVVSVVVRSDNQEDMDAVGDVAQGIRTLIRHPAVRAILAAADIGLARVERTVMADYVEHDVTYSQALIDLAFNTWESYVETVEALPAAPTAEPLIAPYDTSHIAQLVEGVAEITGAGGEQLEIPFEVP